MSRGLLVLSLSGAPGAMQPYCRRRGVSGFFMLSCLLLAILRATSNSCLIPTDTMLGPFSLVSCRHYNAMYKGRMESLSCDYCRPGECITTG
ncbi:hypothetical protein BO82DRAFT_182230 [Aspergillus uvarum CBS 121591]|uniref:Secreted protein n=1 Tax=Aspergillus uvarum CBS 121591 TaxID=1448315 RepID=A0A319DB47_9EURO|nr:hypothetical protein BO82DRAFT_182230 [Aspergillus uvarum CBS 121591]PYH85278.1 hypothetical protein BO82DRAFT_182230 [Aspergillus uvarum CBS 121591]